jgi:hypothetical protein
VFIEEETALRPTYITFIACVVAWLAAAKQKGNQRSSKPETNRCDPTIIDPRKT